MANSGDGMSVLVMMERTVDYSRAHVRNQEEPASSKAAKTRLLACAELNVTREGHARNTPLQTFKKKPSFYYKHNRGLERAQ